MTHPMIDDTVVLERRGRFTIYRRQDLTTEAVLDAFESPGEVLKASAKSTVRRVGPWVVKEGRFQSGAGVLKRTIKRGRYRQGWVAGLFLSQRGIAVPRPQAFIETGRLGIIANNALITEYLDGFHDTEVHAAQLASAPEGEMEAFLMRLADAVNALNAAGAHHTDMAGKNVLTRDGETFHFIDLEAVELDGAYTKVERLRNHIQLHDSLCDWAAPGLLARFIARMNTCNGDQAAWLRAVEQGQQARRARHEAAVRRQAQRQGRPR